MPLDYPILESQIESITFPSIPKTDVTTAKAEIEKLKAANSALTTEKIKIITIKGDNYLEEFANRIASQLESLGLGATVSVYDSNQDFRLNILRPRAYDLLIYEIGLGPIGLYQTTLPYFVNRNVRAFSQENRLVTSTDRFVDIENWATKKTVKNRTP